MRMFNKHILFFIIVIFSLAPKQLLANPLTLDDIHYNSGLFYSSSMVSNADDTAFYYCAGTHLKTYIDSNSSLLLEQSIQLPTEESSNCAIHRIDNKLFVIRKNEFFVFSLDDKGLLVFSKSGTANIGHFDPGQYFSLSESELLLKQSDRIKVVKFNTSDETINYSHVIELREKNMTNMGSSMFKSDSYLVEYVNGFNSAEVIKYKLENDSLIIEDHWYSNDLVDMSFNLHNAHSFFVNSDISHLIYTHDNLQVIYELTNDGKIVRRQRSTDPIKLSALNETGDILIGSIDQDTSGRQWGYSIDYQTYSFNQNMLISNYQASWGLFNTSYVIKDDSEAITFNSNFQIENTKEFGVAKNGLAQVPYFTNSSSMIYDESNQTLFVLGQSRGWKLHSWKYNPELNSLNYGGVFNFNFPQEGNNSAKEVSLLGTENNIIYIKYTPQSESLNNVIYTIALTSGEFELLKKYELSNTNDYGINHVHVKNQGVSLLHENDTDHFYTWCPIQTDGLINSCEEKQFTFSSKLIRPSGTYRFEKLNRPDEYLMYGAEYGRKYISSAPYYSDAHILQFDNSNQNFVLSSTLHGIDGFIKNVYTSQDWSTIFLEIDWATMKGYSLSSDSNSWQEVKPNENYDENNERINQDPIFVTEECTTYVYSYSYEWLYKNSRDEGDFWASDCLPINGNYGFNSGNLIGVQPHIATYNVVEPYPTKQIVNYPYRPDYKQDDIINFDLARYFVNPKNLSIIKGEEHFEFDGQFITAVFDKFEVTGKVGDITTFVLQLGLGEENAQVYEIWFEIENINDAPFLIEPIEKDTLNVGEFYGGDFGEVFTDLEGDQITYTYENLPSEFSIISNGVIEGVFEKSGEYSFVVIATDSYGAATRETVEFTVKSPNSGGSIAYLWLFIMSILVTIRKHQKH